MVFFEDAQMAQEGRVGCQAGRSGGLVRRRVVVVRMSLLVCARNKWWLYLSGAQWLKSVRVE